MSETTIEVPAEHITAIRQGLIGRRSDAGSPRDVENLISQIADDAAGGDRPCTLTGPRVVLWSAVYDALCSGAEQLADDCNDYWRGTIDPETARAGVTAVAKRLELLIGLGAPPGR
jgi:hypothetical protein